MTQSSPLATRRNLRNLYLYNIFLSFSLTIVSGFAFIDWLLLRFRIDLSSFGLIKSLMFLLPAAAYQLLSPLLEKLDKDVPMCILCYLLRGILPLCLPFLAVFSSNRALLTAGCYVLLPGGMLCAAFANNLLMKIYRQVIPPAEYNRNVGLMNMFFSIPALLLSLPVAWLLNRFSTMDDRSFFLLFAGTGLAIFLFELPAVWFMRQVKLPAHQVRVRGSAAKNFIRPYLDGRLRAILGMTFLHRFGIGLGMAYLNVYFLNVMNLSISQLVGISFVLCLLLNCALPCGGRVMDRWGYSRFFAVLSGGLLLGILLFCTFWNAVWILPFFALLTWDGGGSLFGGLLVQGEYAASSALADRAWLGSAVAAYSICSNGGYFLGLLSASGIFALADRLGGEVSTALRLYYAAVIPVFAALFCMTLKMNKPAFTQVGKH